jgi:hypothetical protein
MDRRKFITTSGSAAGAAMIGGIPERTFTEVSGKQQKPEVKTRIKTGLYSISYGGIWYIKVRHCHLRISAGRQKNMAMTEWNSIIKDLWVSHGSEPAQEGGNGKYTC